ncbi:unnamed protein product [Fraxinus pennsylvanica]|uniref:DUF3700 domain-containing protein n=1 Tax=Fraxinus pennsylvanica TaxID=56036 RepID=A0AAD1ZN55_9LAMI|nr:unnamed protein product [Fraxinus pennsylvanica]
MLAIFKKGLVNPPQELNGPVSPQASVGLKNPEEIFDGFLSDACKGCNDFSIGFGDKALLAYAPPEPSFKAHQRLFCGGNDVYCIFWGSLNNLCDLNRQYGLSKGVWFLLKIFLLEEEMLAIFKKGLVNPPQELNGPVSPQASVSLKNPEEILNGFLSDACNDFSIGFGDKALLAYAPPEPSFKAHQRLFCGVNDVYCIFWGSLNNLCDLNRQ